MTRLATIVIPTRVWCVPPSLGCIGVRSAQLLWSCSSTFQGPPKQSGVLPLQEDAANGARQHGRMKGGRKGRAGDEEERWKVFQVDAEVVEQAVGVCGASTVLQLQVSIPNWP